MIALRHRLLGLALLAVADLALSPVSHLWPPLHPALTWARPLALSAARRGHASPRQDASTSAGRRSTSRPSRRSRAPCRVATIMR